MAAVGEAGRASLVDALAETQVSAGYGLVPRSVLIAQSRLETGNWKSDVWRINNNGWGMRLAKVRPTTAVGERAGHAVYRSVLDSVADYWLRQRAFGVPNTPDGAAYIDATVASGYAADPTYRLKWRTLAGMEPRGRWGWAPLALLAYLWSDA